jgi:hypothetical protein
MNDELREAGGPLVAVPPVHQQQPTNVRKLNTKVNEIYRRKRSDAQLNELTRGPSKLVKRFRSSHRRKSAEFRKFYLV